MDFQELYAHNLEYIPHPPKILYQNLTSKVKCHNQYCSLPIKLNKQKNHKVK